MDDYRLETTAFNSIVAKRPLPQHSKKRVID